MYSFTITLFFLLHRLPFVSLPSSGDCDGLQEDKDAPTDYSCPRCRAMDHPPPYSDPPMPPKQTRAERERELREQQRVRERAERNGAAGSGGSGNGDGMAGPVAPVAVVRDEAEVLQQLSRSGRVTRSIAHAAASSSTTSSLLAEIAGPVAGAVIPAATAENKSGCD